MTNFNYDIDNSNNFLDQLAELVVSESASRAPMVGEFLVPMMGLILGAMSGNSNDAIEDFVKRYCDYKVLQQHVEDLRDKLEGTLHQLEDALSLTKPQDQVEGLRDVERNIEGLMPSFNFHSGSTPTADVTRPAREVTLLFTSLACFHLNLLGQLADLDSDEGATFKSKATDLKRIYAQHALSEAPRAAKESAQYLSHAGQYDWNYWPDPYTRDLKRNVHWSAGDPRRRVDISGPAVKEAGLRTGWKDAWLPDVGGRVAKYEGGGDANTIYLPDFFVALTRRAEKFYHVNAVFPINQAPLEWDVKSVALDLVDRYYASDKDGPDKVMPLNNDVINGLEKRFITVATQATLIVYETETDQICETRGRYDYADEIAKFPASGKLEGKWSSICYTNNKLLFYSAEKGVLRVSSAKEGLRSGKILKEYPVDEKWDQMVCHKLDEIYFSNSNGLSATCSVDAQGGITDPNGWSYQTL